MALAHEAFGDGMLEQLNQWREVVARIQQDYRVNVESEALQRQRLEQLFERSASARQRDYAVTLREHQVLAHAQVLDDVQLGKLWVTPLEVLHEARQNSAHFAAAGESAVRDGSHRAFCAAAVDDAVAMLDEYLADAPSRRMIGRVAALARRAIDADCLLHRSLSRA